jgi:hypothetical protein
VPGDARDPTHPPTLYIAGHDRQGSYVCLYACVRICASMCARISLCVCVCV